MSSSTRRNPRGRDRTDGRVHARRRDNPIRHLNPISDVEAARAATAQTMTDLVDAIVATPVPSTAAALRTWRLARGRRRRTSPGRKAPRWLLPAPVLVAAMAALVVVLSAGESGTSLVSRAYAAITPAGWILHYLERTTMSVRIGDRPPERLLGTTSEVWTSGSRTHVLAIFNPSPGSRGGRDAMLEVAIDGNRMTAHVGGRVVHTRSPSCGPERPAAIPLPLAGCATDPVVSLRQAYRSAKLHPAGETVFGGRRVDIISGRVRFPDYAVQNVRVLIDPGTFTPLEVRMTLSGRLTGRSGPLSGRPWQQTTVSTFSHYQRLPLTPGNRKLLTMRPRSHRSPNRSS